MKSRAYLVLTGAPSCYQGINGTVWFLAHALDWSAAFIDGHYVVVASGPLLSSGNSSFSSQIFALHQSNYEDSSMEIPTLFR